MKSKSLFSISSFALALTLIVSLSANAQSPLITDFSIFGGQTNTTGVTTPASPGLGVVLSSSTSVPSGLVGSYVLVQSTGNSTINGSIYSNGRVTLANSNVIGGRITAANTAGLTGSILSVGSSASISGNIDVNGNIVIGGGTVSGRVTQPTGFTYSGPVPAGGRTIGAPSLPVLPAFPAEISFPNFGTTNITGTTTISPGSYGAMTLGGSRTVTFSGPGVYVFRSIKNTGNSNTFSFNFQNTTSGNIQIYVHGDADLGKINSQLVNGGSANRIFLETHGTGSTSTNGTYSFVIANGSSGSVSRWLGTVYASRAAICMGSGTGSTNFTGALWSTTQVLVNSGVTIIHAPLATCSIPNANAGPDRVITCSTPSVSLTGSSTTAGVTYSWTALNGGVISTGATTATPVVSAAGTYVLTVTNTSGGCTARDTAIVTGNLTPPNASAGADQTLTCTTTSVQLLGSSTTAGVSYSWSGPGIVSGGSTASSTVNQVGNYVVTVTNPANGCTSSDVVAVTSNYSVPNADAGTGNALTCTILEVNLSGSSTTSGATYSWSTTIGNIVSGAN
ncbi:MAG: hypothetical protein RIQ47_471, partial [Bacteroidota bacterium]